MYACVGMCVSGSEHFTKVVRVAMVSFTTGRSKKLVWVDIGFKLVSTFFFFYIVFSLQIKIYYLLCLKMDLISISLRAKSVSEFQNTMKSKLRPTREFENSYASMFIKSLAQTTVA